MLDHGREPCGATEIPTGRNVEVRDVSKKKYLKAISPKASGRTDTPESQLAKHANPLIRVLRVANMSI